MNTTANKLSRILLIMIATTTIIGACSTGASLGSDTLQGTWKSDAPKTLESMNLVIDLTPAAREIFEDDFFGHLFVEFRGNEVRSWLDDEDYETEFEAYELLEESGSRITIREWNHLSEKAEVVTLILEGDCYKRVTSAFEFYEYFCRVEKHK